MHRGSRRESSIAKLETEIGLRLFHRTRHGAVLTSDGETLLVPARRILQDFDLFDEAASGIRHPAPP